MELVGIERSAEDPKKSITEARENDPAPRRSKRKHARTTIKTSEKAKQSGKIRSLKKGTSETTLDLSNRRHPTPVAPTKLQVTTVTDVTAIVLPSLRQYNLTDRPEECFDVDFVAGVISFAPTTREILTRLPCGWQIFHSSSPKVKAFFETWLQRRMHIFSWTSTPTTPKYTRSVDTYLVERFYKYGLFLPRGEITMSKL